MESREIWVVRPNPDGTNRMAEFIDEGVIAIGWPEFPDLWPLSKTDIMQRLQENEKQATRRSVRLQAGMIYRFAHEMEEGDIVFIPNGDLINVARISSCYRYNVENKDDGYPHQRSVIWIKKEISRKSLPPAIQSALRPQMALFSISKHKKPILAWLEEDASVTGVSLDDMLYLRMWDGAYRFDPDKVIDDFYRVYEVAVALAPKRELDRADEILKKAEYLMKWEPSQNHGIIEDEDHLRQIAQWAQDGLLEQEVNRVKAIKSEELKTDIQLALSSKDGEALVDVILNAPSRMSLPPRSGLPNRTIEEMLTSLDRHHRERLKLAQTKAEDIEFSKLISFLSPEQRQVLREKLNDARTEKSQQDD